MLYVIKKFASAFLGPLAIAGLLALVAAWYVRRGHRRIGRVLIGTAIAICYLGATPLIGGLLIGSLENRCPPYVPSANMQVRYVVVLGANYVPNDNIPITAALNSEGVVRVTEGMRLYRHLSEARLVLSGGAPEGRIPSALGYQRMALDFGIPDASLIVLNKPLDTAEEAKAVFAALGTEPFLLVTSASHMPRAMRLMAGAGAHPTAAPTGQRAATLRASWRQLVPQAEGLQMTERALHEYLGLLTIAISQSAQ